MLRVIANGVGKGCLCIDHPRKPYIVHQVDAFSERCIVGELPTAARELNNVGGGGGGGQICAPNWKLFVALAVCFRACGVSISRWYLVYGTSGSWGKTWGGIITSITNSVQIQILNALYKTVAVALTGTLLSTKGV